MPSSANSRGKEMMSDTSGSCPLKECLDTPPALLSSPRPNTHAMVGVQVLRPQTEDLRPEWRACTKLKTWDQREKPGVEDGKAVLPILYHQFLGILGKTNKLQPFLCYSIWGGGIFVMGTYIEANNKLITKMRQYPYEWFPFLQCFFSAGSLIGWIEEPRRQCLRDTRFLSLELFSFYWTKQ